MKQFLGIMLLAWLTGCMSSSGSSTDEDAIDQEVQNEEECSDTSCDSEENMNTDENMNISLPDREPWVADQEEIADCTEGLSQSEINSNLLIVDNLNKSYHEMIVCGGLYFNMIFALIDLVRDLLEDTSNIKLPDGYTTDGKGTYTAQASGFTNVQMDVQFFYGEDYEVGAKGDLITHNLFDPDNYLVNPSVDLNVLNATATIKYSSTGPLVELLGKGANPPNPIKLGINDITSFAGDMGKQLVDQTMIVVDERYTTTVSYTVDSSLQSVSSILSSGLIDLDMVDAAAEDSVKPQSLVIDDWNVQYSENDWLDGNIDFTVTGGDFDFKGIFTYNDAAFAEISLTCEP